MPSDRPFQLTLISDSAPALSVGLEAGVRSFMVDLEARGKRERQRGRDTLISHHMPSAISTLRGLAGSAEVIVRINPYSDRHIEEDLAEVIGHSPDAIMLPLAEGADQLEVIRRICGTSIGLIPLVETQVGLLNIREILRVPGLLRVHLGLNDLQLDLGYQHMLDAFRLGVVDDFAEVCGRSGMPFRIGGIGPIDALPYSGRSLLDHHRDLGSEGAFLSRQLSGLAEQGARRAFAAEVERLQHHWLSAAAPRD